MSSRVIGLNADLLDGYQGAAYPRKTENAFVTGGWTFGGTAGGWINLDTDTLTTRNVLSLRVVRQTGPGADDDAFLDFGYDQNTNDRWVISQFVNNAGVRKSLSIGISTNLATNLVINTLGNTLLGTATAATDDPRLDVVGGDSAITAVFADHVGDANSKQARIGLRHFTNEEEPIAILLAQSDAATTAALNWGGGTGAMNAPTIQRWYTAADSTTLTGTPAADLTGVGANAIFRSVGFLKTGTPISGTADQWKLGSRVTGASVALVVTEYVEIDINGTAVRLGVVA